MTFGSSVAPSLVISEEGQERGLDICNKSWFILERRLNGQRQQPGSDMKNLGSKDGEKTDTMSKRTVKTNIINASKKRSWLYQ